MSRRGGICLTLALAALLLAGCQAQERDAQVMRVNPELARGDGVHLFGPTPLPLGEEGHGYFAYAAPVREPLLMFDRSAVYVRSWTRDVEDNHGLAQPGRDHLSPR